MSEPRKPTTPAAPAAESDSGHGLCGGSARLCAEGIEVVGLGPAVVAVRLDKWLWAVRLFKTRTLATAACQGGHVKLNGQRVKPAHTVRPGEVIEVQLPGGPRTVKVLAPLEQRVGAKLVPRYLEDLTPPGPRPTPGGPRLEPLFHRPKGAGRPTKRERRQLREFGFLPPED